MINSCKQGYKEVVTSLEEYIKLNFAISNFAVNTTFTTIMLKINTICLTVFCLLFAIEKSQAQGWVPGYYYDVQNNKNIGLIKLKPSNKEPIKDEAFIEFKTDNKANSIKLSASELSSFVMGRDSFVVAAAPRTGAWSKNELDFVEVILDEDDRIYMFNGLSGSGGGSGWSLGLGGGFGGGGGGFGYGVGTGVSIPLGGGGHHATSYFYGRNTAEMKELTPFNFIAVMSDIMGDEPEVVEQIQQNKYSLRNIDKLIAYYYKVQGEHNSQKP